MISAIAARKAAQANRQVAVETNSSPSSPDVSILQPPPNTPGKPLSKRRSVIEAQNPKKKKVKRHEVNKPRYFEEKDDSENEENENTIIIDSDDDQTMSDEPGTVPLPNQSFLAEGSAPKMKRRWSPSVPLKDSSDEDEGEDPRQVTGVSNSLQSVTEDPPSLLSTFRPTRDQNTFLLTADEVNSLGLHDVNAGSAAIVALAPSQTLCLLGMYSLTITHGSVSISGVHLSASRTCHRIFAPKSSPIPVLEHRSGGNSSNPQVSLPERIISLCTGDNAVIILQELRVGIEGLGRVCRTFDNVFEPSRWQRDDPGVQLGIPGIHILASRTKDIQPFLLPPSWALALSSISSDIEQPVAGIYLVKGPKKTGKSTFARTLLNRLLMQYQKVAFLECDLGQSEFTPGGLVALHVIDQPIFGPPFTHPTLPNFAHYIGATSPQSSPSHYLTAIQCLLQSYRLEMKKPLVEWDTDGDSRVADVIPLIVNTMGWTKGLGLDLTRKIEDFAEPTHVFEVEAPVYESGYALQPPPQIHFPRHGRVFKTHILEPMPPSVLSTNYSPADHRSLSILSYLHANFPNTVPGELQQVTALSWNVTLPLCAIPPYEVDCTIAFDKVVLSAAGAEDVVPEEIRRVLNGAIVGLVCCDPGTTDLERDMAVDSQNSSIPYSQGSSVPSPSTSTCHGLALIRSVSPSSSHLHMLTPVPSNLLSKCRVIVKGEMDLPIWGFLDFRDESGGVAGIEKSKVPYLQWGRGEGIGGERRRVRRNLMRKSQM